MAKKKLKVGTEILTILTRRVKINKNPKVRNDTSDTSNEPALSRGTIKKMNRMRDTVGVS
jgi:hypothetical protein